MTEQVTAEKTLSEADRVAELQARADSLEHQIAAYQRDTDARLVLAGLKVEAVRAGIIDIDGLKLVDPSHLKLNPDGEVDGAAALIAELKKAKPWLFAVVSSSTTAKAPAALPPRQKQANEMNDDEYRAARAALLKRRG